ncbi:hypothetical protein [Leifsonia sp. EB34]|uniref:hypothetical protein n=1 Tax=Leifsonia sp. EB34 TaxID=3156303 RepID=UPI003513145D
MSATPPAVSPKSLSDMRSACPHAGLSAAARFDPYWAGIWEAGAHAAWVSADSASRQAAAGLAIIPNHLSMSADAGWERLFTPSRLSKQLRVLGALNMWRTVTAEQLAAITGIEAIASGRSTDMAAQFALGLTDVGQVGTVLGSTARTARAALYRPAATEVFRTKISPRLTYPERIAVTGGLPYASSSQYDRHNVLAAELALRVAEYCEIGTVLGERLSGIDLLTGSGIGRPRITGTTRAADATLVRTDGARIAIELTASTGERFENKVRKWAAVLSTLRMAETGLAVLFVIAGRPERKANAGVLRDKVLQTIARAARDYPGVSFDRTASRLLVADWQEWFPSPGKVSPSFLTLDAIRPTGEHRALWQKASALDVFDVEFAPSNPESALAILENANALGGVPLWLRTGTGPALWPLAIAEAGYNRIPVPRPTHPTTSAGLRLGAAKGAAGAARAPQRLGAPLGRA